MTGQEPSREDATPSPRWRDAVRSGATAGQDALRSLTRWQQAEVTLTRIVVAGLSLALPIALGSATGLLPLGMMAAIGALLMSSSGHTGSIRFRLLDMGATLVVGTLAVSLGVWASALAPAASAVVIVVTATVLAAVGGFHRTAAKISTLATVFLIIGASTGAHASVPLVATATAAGALFAALLTLCGIGVDRLLGIRVAPAPPSLPLAESVRAWRARMRTPLGWQYTLRLGSSLVVAEIVALSLRGSHAYWIPLTIALVVQRDHTTELARTVQRGVGTAVGVLLSALFLFPAPIWVTILTLAVIGGLRPYLRGANYAAYAIVMTPLVAVLTGLGHAMTTGVLWERLTDTLIGCVIAVVVGWGAWSWLTRPAARRG